MADKQVHKSKEEMYMNGFLFFILAVSAIIFIFGKRLMKWFNSLGQAADRKEHQKWKEFDEKINPSIPIPQPKAKAKKKGK